MLRLVFEYCLFCICICQQVIPILSKLSGACVPAFVPIVAFTVMMVSLLQAEDYLTGVYHFPRPSQCMLTGHCIYAV